MTEAADAVKRDLAEGKGEKATSVDANDPWNPVPFADIDGMQPFNSQPIPLLPKHGVLNELHDNADPKMTMMMNSAFIHRSKQTTC